MAGIVGYVGARQADSILLESLRKLEYRGYDSTDLAIGSREAVHAWHAEGTLRILEAAVRLDPVRGTWGVGQTAWRGGGAGQAGAAGRRTPGEHGILVALAGRPSNIPELRERMPVASGSTNAEVLADLIARHLGTHGALEEAVSGASFEIRGRCAIAAIARSEPGKVVAAQVGLPVVVGLGKNENLLTSHISAILHRTRDMIHLEDGDVAVLTERDVMVLDSDARPVYRPVQHVLWDPLMAEKSGYKHLMLKEIFEQPGALRSTMLGRLDEETGRVVLDELGVTGRELREIQHMNVIGSGSSWHAALASKAMIEQLARVHVEVEYGSELRYSDPVVDEYVLSLLISRSGETADTLASQSLLHEKGSKTIAVCNTVGSTLANMARGAIYTKAGPEMAAASTKSFTSQLTALYLLAMFLGQVRGRLSTEESRRCAKDLQVLPDLVESALELSQRCERIARMFAQARRVVCLGRGPHYAIALEGARMFMELCHIQAEGCAAGEMRHGPTALIDSNVVVIVLATVDESNESSRLRYAKTLSQVKQVAARQGRVICIANQGDENFRPHASEVIWVPQTRELLQPVLTLIPLQLMAYHVAVSLGRDVDQPRNIGRSVTAD